MSRWRIAEIVLGLITAGIAGALLVTESDPKADGLQFTGLLILSAAPVLLAAISLLVRVFRTPRGMRGRTARAGLRTFLLLPAIVGVAVLVSILQWPFRFRFEISRVALESVAHEVMLDRHELETARWIGLYHVKSVDMTQTGLVQFHLGDCTWYNACDLVFHPKADCTAGLSTDGSVIDRHWCLEYWGGF